MSTAADIWKIYVKPSLDGKIVFRKRKSLQDSARLQARKDKLQALPKKSQPSVKCHDALVKEGECPVKRVYKPGVGYEEKPVCPIKKMMPCLRREMAAI